MLRKNVSPPAVFSDYETIIRIKNLNHFYGSQALRKQVLFDINLQVHAGEVVILSGPSGSGKTTLLTVAGCLRTLQEGSVEILGVELSSATAKCLAEMRRKIGYIFQAHNLHPSLSAVENVMLGLEMHGRWTRPERHKLAAALLQDVGLGERLHLRPHQLSGGQKQRVAIARALIGQPRIILADEPTASLDKKSGREVVDLLHHLASSTKASVLLITHDNRILDIADHLVYMEDGRLVEDVHGTILHRLEGKENA